MFGQKTALVLKKLLESFQPAPAAKSAAPDPVVTTGSGTDQLLQALHTYVSPLQGSEKRNMMEEPYLAIGDVLQVLGKEFQLR